MLVFKNSTCKSAQFQNVYLFFTGLPSTRHSLKLTGDAEVQ